MIIKLQGAMKTYAQQKRTKMTYEVLSERTGITHSRLKSIGSRRGYNASLKDLNLICAELGLTAGELLQVEEGQAEKYRKKLLAKARSSNSKKAKKNKKD